LSPFEAVRKTLSAQANPIRDARCENATSTVAFARVPAINQFGTLMGLPDLGGVRNDPTGTTTCFGFLGFFASLFPRTWPFAMVMLLATSL
jgi:hypothetical protein